MKGDSLIGIIMNVHQEINTREDSYVLCIRIDADAIVFELNLTISDCDGISETISY